MVIAGLVIIHISWLSKEIPSNIHFTTAREQSRADTSLVDTMDEVFMLID